MNTPAHVAAGGFVCLMILYADERLGGRLPLQLRPWVRGTAGVVLGAGSHLLLDALPHYNWVVYMDWLTGLPYHWLVRNAIFGFIVFLPLLFWGRDRWWLVCLTVFAAMYPDFEKVACVDHGLPHQLVIFTGHSTALSGHDGGLPRGWLVALELAMTAGMLLLAFGISRVRRSRGSFATVADDNPSFRGIK